MSISLSTIWPEGAASQLTIEKYCVCASGMTSSPRPAAPAKVLGKLGSLPRHEDRAELAGQLHQHTGFPAPPASSVPQTGSSPALRVS